MQRNFLVLVTSKGIGRQLSKHYLPWGQYRELLFNVLEGGCREFAQALQFNCACLACQHASAYIIYLKKWQKTLPMGGDLSIINELKVTSGELREASVQVLNSNLAQTGSYKELLGRLSARGDQVKHLLEVSSAATIGSADQNTLLPCICHFLFLPSAQSFQTYYLSNFPLYPS